MLKKVGENNKTPMEKRILKNAIFNMLNKTLSIAFPVITISYVSRILGPSGIGIVSSAQNIVSYFVMFASLGIPAYGVRAIAQTKDNKTVCNKTFTELFLFNAMSTIVCTIMYFVIIMNNSYFEKTIELNIVFGSILLMNFFNIEWVHQAFEEFRFIAIRSFVVKVIALLMLFIFCKEKNDILAYSIITCVGLVGNYILNIIKIFKHISFDFDSLDIKKHLKPIILFFASVVAIELYSLVDLTMLSFLKDAKEVGYYANSSKIVKTVAGMFSAIGAVLMPRLSVLFDKGEQTATENIIKKMLRIISLFTFPSCVGIILTAHKIVPIFFGNEFIPAVSTLRILSVLIVFMPISGGITAQILQSSNKERILLISVSGGAITNIILNLLLINCLGRNGAAIASVITEMLVTVVTMVYSNRIVKVKLNAKFVFSIIFSVTIMSIVLMFLQCCNKNSISICWFIIEIIIGATVYFIMMILCKNEEAIEVINKLKKKIRIGRV